MNKEVTYSNRYRDQIKFELQDSKTIKVTGYSPYYRIGWPNVYDKAYEAYVKSAREDAGLDWNWILSQEEFERDLHMDKLDDYNSHKNALYSIFGKHIYSDTDTIDMWDPSGGPYLSAGQDMRQLFGSKHKPLIIKKFKTEKDCVLIILK